MLVAGDGNVSVIWDAKIGEVKRLYLRTSTDHGKTFGPVTELDVPAGAADYPAMAAGKNGRVLIAWQQNNQVRLRAMPVLVAQQ